MARDNELVTVRFHATEAEINTCTLHPIPRRPWTCVVTDALGKPHKVELRRVSITHNATRITRTGFYAAAEGQGRQDYTQEGAIRALAVTCGWPQSK